MGIVQKAVAAGVPIAAVPFGRDQPEVARRFLVEAGAGVRLRIKDLSAERLRATVREALRCGRRRRAAGARLRVGRRRALRRLRPKYRSRTRSAPAAA